MQTVPFLVANLVTALLDGLVAVLAVLFVASWGQRVTAWPVLSLTWAGTGLLAPIALGVPLGVVVQGLLGGGPVAADAALDSCTRFVFGGFTVQAALLPAGFVR